MKVVINRCFGGFGLSDAAYEKLIEWGIPVRKYQHGTRGPDGLWLEPQENEGEVIFDNDLIARGEDASHDKLYWAFKGRARSAQRYWDDWIRRDISRAHPLIVRAVEELGPAANGFCAELAVVEIPDGIEWEISEYDGLEQIAEKHRTWA